MNGDGSGFMMPPDGIDMRYIGQKKILDTNGRSIDNKQMEQKIQQEMVSIHGITLPKETFDKMMSEYLVKKMSQQEEK